MSDTLTVKIGRDEIGGIPKSLSEADIRESLADLRPEVANYDGNVLEFVPRPATKG